MFDGLWWALFVIAFFIFGMGIRIQLWIDKALKANPEREGIDLLIITTQQVTTVLYIVGSLILLAILIS